MVTCLRLCVLVLAALSMLSVTPANALDKKFPDKIDTAKRYMFYMHGLYVERQGPFEAYQYYEILDAIEAKGFVVIGEARGLTNVNRYATALAKQVQTLLDAGVPSYQITVAGHSRGGMIALATAAKIKRPGVNYAVLAGCGLKGTEYRRGLAKFIKKEASSVDGTFLVAWAADDHIAGDCDDVMKLSKATFKNKMLPAGKGGHKFFNTPDPEWLNVLTSFAEGG